MLTSAATRFVFFASLLLLSIFFTNRIYGAITDKGQEYYKSFYKQDMKPYRQQERLGIRYIFETDAQKNTCRAKVSFVSDNARNSQKRLFDVNSGVVSGGVTMSTRTNSFVVENSQDFQLLKKHYLVTFEDDSDFFRHSKSLTFELPPGAISATIDLLAARISNEGKVQLDPDVVQDIGREVSAFIAECHNLHSWGEDYWFLRMMSGWVQYLIVGLAVYCGLIFCIIGVGTLVQEFRGQKIKVFVFAIEAAENIIEIIPYVGFFGTIMGMSGALWILGRIDTTDAVQKATELGPISSDISLALETTKLALIIFIIYTLGMRLLRISVKKMS